MSFGSEVAELMENKQVWAEVIKGLANIYQMYTRVTLGLTQMNRYS